MTSMSLLGLAAKQSAGQQTQLIVAALIGIALLVFLIVKYKIHPFLSLILGSLAVGAVAGENLNDTVDSFSTGVGDTVASVGVLIALGAIVGKLLVDSGGADELVNTIVGRASSRSLPWAMAVVGAVIGLPMFFEIGLVLLIPIVLLVARRSGLPLMRIAVPTLAGLSIMHGLVPPHPGPLIALAAFHANLGLTLGLGLIVAIPTVIIAGPVFSRFAARWVDVPVPDLFQGDSAEQDTTQGTPVEESEHRRRPSFRATLFTVLLPVVLMLSKFVVDLIVNNTNATVQKVFDFIGNPFIALLIAALAAIFTLGMGAGQSLRQVGGSVEASFAPIASITFIVAAGGGFKQVLVDSGISDIVAGWVENSSVSALFLAWLVAVLIRLGTGSATVATVTASGILAPLAADLSTSHAALLVLAVGSGSLFFSHVNDAGFWLVKQYFGLSVGQTIKSWSVMETIISVSGIVFVLILSLIV